MLTPISFTPRALDEIKRLHTLLRIPNGYVVRVSVKKTDAEDASPFSIGFDVPDKNDLTFTTEGVVVHYHKLQGMQLAGTEIDFDADENGFIFRQ